MSNPPSLYPVSVILCVYPVLLMSFSGCTTPSVHVHIHDASSLYSPVTACEVYRDSSRVPYRFFPIGHINGEEVTKVSDATQLQDIAKALLRDMATKASQIGADGIIANIVVHYPEWSFVTDIGGITATKNTLALRGTLIRFERDADGNPIRR